MADGGHVLHVGPSSMYYEDHGSGTPIVMLHGDCFTLDNFVHQIPEFARHHRVVLPERRGHGRTPDVPGEYTYPLFARDTIMLLDALGVRDAILLGESGGADIAMVIAVERPDLVRALIPISGESRLENSSERRERIRSISVEDFRKMASVVLDSYERLTPDGRGKFPAVFEKVKRLWTTDWEIPDAALRGLRVPTLVMVADHDFGSVEDAAALARKIPDAELCVVPGTTHGLLLQRPDLANSIILDFLARRAR